MTKGVVQRTGMQTVKSLHGLARIQRRQRRYEARSGYDMDVVRGSTGYIGQKVLQVLLGVSIANRRRCGDETHTRRVHFKAVQDPPEQQCHLGGLGANVGMGLVEDDPAQLTTGLFENRLILSADEHVLQHRRVGDEHWCRGIAESLP